MSRLFIIATPIGNLEDISLRAIRVFGELDALACEDTRFTLRIFQRHGITSPKIIFSYHEHNEEKSGMRIIDLLKMGMTVGLCTDGGYPGISDPGYRIITFCHEEGFPIDVIPGPNAVINALVASGLPTSSFTFKGFPPRKIGQRERFLEMDRNQPHTLVFFESPYRILKLLEAALKILGDRMAAVCIELTKKFEEIRRDYLSNLIKSMSGHKIKGEITVVIAGNNPKFLNPETEIPLEQA